MPIRSYAPVLVPGGHSPANVVSNYAVTDSGFLVRVHVVLMLHRVLWIEDEFPDLHAAALLWIVSEETSHRLVGIRNAELAVLVECMYDGGHERVEKCQRNGRADGR